MCNKRGLPYGIKGTVRKKRIVQGGTKKVEGSKVMERTAPSVAPDEIPSNAGSAREFLKYI